MGACASSPKAVSFAVPPTGLTLDMTNIIDIPFQPNVSQLFTHSLKTGRLHSAYLFTGNEGVGKWMAAIIIASKLLSLQWDRDSDIQACVKKTRKLIHPDLHILFPMPSPKTKAEEAELPQFFRETKAHDPFAPVEYGRAANILVHKVRELKISLYSTPAEGGYRIAIFQQVERMPVTSFDILLKTIEEPPPRTVLFLLTDNARRLPQTVISRCQKVRFAPVARSFIEDYLIRTRDLDPDEARRFAALSGGSFTEACKLCEVDISDRRDIAIRTLKAFVSGGKTAGLTALWENVNLRNQDESMAIVKLWQSLIRDALLVKENVDDSLLTNYDLKNDLEVIASSYGNLENMCISMVELLESQKLFYRNVPPRHALTQAGWRLAELSSSGSSHN